MSLHTFKDICRVCQCKINGMSSIFSTIKFNGTPSRIFEVMLKYASVQIEENDGLPEWICVDCVVCLQGACKFKYLCERSDVELRNQLLLQTFDSTTSNEAGFFKRSHALEDGKDVGGSSVRQPNCVETHNMSESISDCLELEIMNCKEEIDSEASADNNDFENCNEESDVNEDPSEDTSRQNQLDEFYNCSKCKANFQNYKEWRTHTSLCNSKSATENGNIALHCKPIFEESNSSKHHQCDICKNTFSRKYYLKLHAAIHSNEKRFACEVCSKRFTLETTLRVHKETHFENWQDCVECNLRFKTNSALSRHRRSVHKLHQLICNVCAKSFARNYQLVSHMATHSDETPYSCDLCDKKFKIVSTLNAHKKTHGDKLIRCSQCEARFKSSSSLSHHVRVHHLRDLPYDCVVCKMRFVSQSRLKMHIATHTGEKPYKCDICGNNYRLEKALKVHVKTHNSDRPFKCEICSKAYKVKSYLTDHLKTHSGEKHTCDVCGRDFASKKYLKVHAEVHKKGVI